MFKTFAWSWHLYNLAFPPLSQKFHPVQRTKFLSHCYSPVLICLHNMSGWFLLQRVRYHSQGHEIISVQSHFDIRLSGWLCKMPWDLLIIGKLLDKLIALLNLTPTQVDSNTRREVVFKADNIRPKNSEIGLTITSVETSVSVK